MTSQINTITIELPIKVDVEEAKLMIFLSLFGKGAISSGKAAHYLNMDRLSFLDQASNYGMTIYSDDEDSLEDALDIKL
jgi:predicted HTH domain antitoxin